MFICLRFETHQFDELLTQQFCLCRSLSLPIAGRRWHAGNATIDGNYNILMGLKWCWTRKILNVKCLNGWKWLNMLKSPRNGSVAETTQRKMRRKLNGSDCGLRYDKLLRISCADCGARARILVRARAVCLIHWFKVISHDDVRFAHSRFSHSNDAGAQESVFSVCVCTKRNEWSRHDPIIKRIAQEHSIPHSTHCVILIQIIFSVRM